MANERLILAIGQLERALTRLEAAHVRHEKNAATLPDQAGGDLATRHMRLKAAAADALAGLDAVLAGNR